MEEFTFGDVEVDPAETRKVELELFGKCANFWRSNQQYDLTETIRPTRPTGYAYQASSAGTSGAREPVWPTALAGTVADGSVIWTCVAAGSNGVSAISAPSAVSDPVGLTIGSVSASESTKILASYSGGSLGQDYDAVFTFTLNGVSRVARQRVLIRKR